MCLKSSSNQHLVPDIKDEQASTDFGELKFS
jgi:hypothetical protein